MSLPPSDEERLRTHDAILEILRSGPALRNIDIRISLKRKGIDVMSTRQLDRTLQKLREEGLIKFTQQRWMASNVSKCDACKGTGFVNHDPVPG